MFLSGYGVFLAFVIFSIAFACAALIVAWLCRPKAFGADNKNKTSTYECGMEPKGSGQIRFDIKYYMFAILFILFEVETIFLFPWAVSYNKLGLFALVEAIIFIAILALGLAYAWRKGLLEWK